MLLQSLLKYLNLQTWNFNAWNSRPGTAEVLLMFTAAVLIWVFLYSRLRKKSHKYPPGPVGLPLLGYLPFLGREPHKTLVKMKEKYGDIIGLYLGPRYTIVFNEYTVAKEAISHSAALDRAPNIFGLIPLLGFITANGNEWVEQRRFCMASSRDLGLGRGQWERLIAEEVQNFIVELRKSEGKPIEISNILSSSVSSNIISLLIGRPLKKEEEREKLQLSMDFSKVAFTYTGPLNTVSLIPWLRKYLEFFRIAGYDKAAKAIKGFSEFIREEISRHKISQEFRDVHDFINKYLKELSKMATSENKKHYFSEQNLEGNLNILFLGASDTTFSSLGWLFRLMAEHQNVQQNVYKELMDKIGKDGSTRYEERHKVPFTFAVLMEAQRYSSMVPFPATRKANHDFTVRGYLIPKGAEIVTNLWALHHDPNYWENPEIFKPERFLTEDGKTLVKSPPSYAPFSIGRRNCPGETVAWMEILTYFSEIIKRFEVTAVPGDKPKFDVINGLVERLKPQLLCFKERSDQP